MKRRISLLALTIAFVIIYAIQEMTQRCKQCGVFCMNVTFSCNLIQLGLETSLIFITGAAFATEEVHNVDTQFAGRLLTVGEQDAARNAVKNSQHTHIQLMPNHALDEDSDLQGFVFRCAQDESSACLPMPRDMFRMITVYECESEVGAGNMCADAIRIVNNIDFYNDLLKQYTEELLMTCDNNALFDCVPETDITDDDNIDRYEDQRAWSEVIPSRMGVFHSYLRSHAQETRTHKLFIVVQGAQTKAAEALHTLWSDIGNRYTAKDFVESEEVLWLRQATLRNHQRVAARIAEIFQLTITQSVDALSPGREPVGLPSLQTPINDIQLDMTLKTVSVTNKCAFLQHSGNGMVMEMCSSEGVWIFHGPKDNTNYNAYGGRFEHMPDAVAFPTSTVQFHELFPSAMRSNVVRQRIAAASTRKAVVEPVVDIHAEKQSAFKSDSETSDHDSGEVGENEADSDDNGEARGAKEQVPPAPPMPADLERTLARITQLLDFDDDPNDLDRDFESRRLKDLDTLNLNLLPSVCQDGLMYARPEQHTGHYLLPDEGFYECLQKLGFDRNDGVTVLMPMCGYIHGE